jgi:hypothetical protein
MLSPSMNITSTQGKAGSAVVVRFENNRLNERRSPRKGKGILAD